MVCFDAPKVLEKFIPMLVQLILEQHQSQNILIEHFKVFSHKNHNFYTSQ